MATSRLLLLAATLALVCLVGSASAWEKEHEKKHEKECPKGFKNCNPHKWGCETCVAKDANNCGECGKKCKTVWGAYSKCDYGYCKYSCKPGYANCDYKWENGCEVNTENDSKNCGKCGNCCKQVSNAYTPCQGGKCCEPVCNKGYGNCDGNIWKNGCEKDLLKDVYNCGKCGNKCPCSLKDGEPTCSWGKCGEQCKKGFKYDSRKKCCVPSWH